jgi:glycerophosphoryl diester phosphodiesterase
MIVIAHRGASGDFIENTASSLRAAVEGGAHMLETDLHLTRDGHLVLHHDSDTLRLLGARGRIERKDLGELRALRYVNGEAMLTLDELFSIVQGTIPINLELKGQGTGAALLAALRSRAYRGKILISAKRVTELHPFRTVASAVPLGLVVEHLSAATWRRLEDGSLQFVSLQRRAFSAARHARLRSLGVRCYLYTVNDPTEMMELAAAGADGIFTDYPALALALLQGAPPGVGSRFRHEEV